LKERAGATFDSKIKEERPYRDRDQLRFLIVLGGVMGDLVVIYNSSLLASWLRFGDTVSGDSFDLFFAICFPYLLAGMLLDAFHIDHLQKQAGSIRRALVAFGTAFIVIILVAVAFKVSAEYSRLETGYMAILGALGLILWRKLFSLLVRQRFAALAESAVIVLGDSVGLADERLRECAIDLIDVEEREWEPRFNHPDFLNRLGKEIGHADRVVLALSDDQVRRNWIYLARVLGVDAEVWQPDFLEDAALGLNTLKSAPTLIVSRGPLQTHERVLKRLMDLCLSFPSLILLAPLMALVAILIKMDSPGPVFSFRSEWE